jgi:protocatechuate 3,4-dioxygenase beta subunit
LVVAAGCMQGEAAAGRLRLHTLYPGRVPASRPHERPQHFHLLCVRVD